MEERHHKDSGGSPIQREAGEKVNIHFLKKYYLCV